MTIALISTFGDGAGDRMGGACGAGIVCEREARVGAEETTGDFFPMMEGESGLFGMAAE